MKSISTVIALAALVLPMPAPKTAAAQSAPDKAWTTEFPRTDFAKSSVRFDTIITDGPKRDQIPPIHEPKFIAAAADTDVGPLEPVISIDLNGDPRAYPLRILLWHEIVNDTVGGIPVLVSYCPLCNSGVVFDRRVQGRILTFGNTGRIRHFDMVMYDHQTESWWQQFLGEAIVGELTGVSMKLIPARLESLERFRQRRPQGKLLIPTDGNARNYGLTPYRKMDRSTPAVFRRYQLPQGLSGIDRVVVIGNGAWPLKLLRAKKKIVYQDLTLTWTPGQNSIHDEQIIARGRDVGNVVVKRGAGVGAKDVPYDVTFAFAFKAFRPDGAFHLK